MHAILLLILLLSSCTAKSPETFLAKGRVINQELLEVAKDVEDLESLMQALPRFTRLFNQLVDLMIQARKWQAKHHVSWQPTDEDRLLSQELAAEFARIYQIPTARAFLEKCEQPSLERLDAFEKKLLLNLRG